MRTEARTLADLLFGQTRGRILALLYGNPDQPLFVRQIARQVGTSVGTVQRELEILSEPGLIKRSTIGIHVFYQANRNHPAFNEIHSLIAKTTGIFHQIRSALAPLSPRISFAFIYGSVARGEEDANSDIDLMVVGSATLDEILTHLGPAEALLGRPINPTVYSLQELKAKLETGNHFLSSVMQGKRVFLVGDENEFREMG